MLRWVLPVPVDFTTSPASLFAIPNLVDDGNLSAAAFDEDKRLLFFVKYGAQPDALLYDANGVQRGTLPAYRTTSNRTTQSGAPYTYPEWGREMAVVPVPGACKRFYLFYVQSSVIPSLACCPSFTVLLRATIDCNGATPIVLSPPTPVDESLTEPFYGIAVSKEANGTRRLYFVNNRDISSYTISSAGVSAATRYNQSSNLNMQPLEADLSPDGTRLAMTASRGTRGVWLADVNPATGAVNNLRTVGDANVQTYGVEFSPDSKKIYYAGEASTTIKGIYELILATNATQQLRNTVANACFGSQLELAYDGLIYAADDQDQLVTVDPVTNAVAVAPAVGVVRPIPSYCNSVPNRTTVVTRALPDQIDGQDYTYFIGTPSPQMGSLSVAAEPLGRPRYRNLYTCEAPLLLNATLTNCVEARVTIKQTDAAGTIVAGGYQNQTSWLPAATSFDLATLFGGYLVASPDYYEVTYEGRNGCGNVTRRIGLARINNEALSADFVFNTGTEGPDLVPGDHPGAASEVGGLGGAVQLVNNPGFDTYKATIEEYVNGGLTTLCSVGSVSVPAGTYTIKLNDIVNNGLGPNSYNGYPNYFAQRLGSIYKITLTLLSPCATAIDVTGYFTPVSASYIAAPSGNSAPGFAAYPNPTNGSRLRVEYALPAAQTVQVRILDAQTGQERLLPLPRTRQRAGAHALDIDLSALPPGSYIYRVEADQLISKRFIKSE
ncbi:MAG TPA: T9SS type A sorting domain-containing protein [Hymenobacter sp.]|jgi:hypothetical protein|uniref:T9SS type A sorting domain-containing protein n=1 Tax=Hymenobacter sp. TaxID=1898978 RepID=UPI002ED82696